MEVKNLVISQNPRITHAGSVNSSAKGIAKTYLALDECAMGLAP
mgnify:CR=1 FL=1